MTLKVKVTSVLVGVDCNKILLPLLCVAGTGSSTYAGGAMGSSVGAGHAGSSSLGGAGAGMGDSRANQGPGSSIDPRSGNLGDDDDLSRIRGSNIG